MGKRSRRLRTFTSARDEPRWTQPARSSCTEYGGCSPLDAPISAQFCAFQWWYGERHELVDFSYEIQVKRPSDEQWQVVYRADAKHGTIHEHRFWPNGQEDRIDLRSINATSDVNVMSDTLRSTVMHEYRNEIRRGMP
jgi:hypothetical protein